VVDMTGFIKNSDRGQFRDVFQDLASGASEIRELAKKAPLVKSKPENELTSRDRVLLDALDRGVEFGEIMRLGGFASMNDATAYLVDLDLGVLTRYLAMRHVAEQEADAVKRENVNAHFAEDMAPTPTQKSAPVSSPAAGRVTVHWPSGRVDG
jgi:hypothetical protein